ncbi:MAG TPA: hypothetical protein VLF61_02050 [Rhabdochlamydiaceae bacterium]|nr:hypothetical protein [Rhabdochlamydiaceae bacterium]
MKQNRYQVEGKKFFVVDLELDIDLCGDLSKAKHERILDDNGRLQYDAYYLNGQLHGPSTFYSDEETILSLTWFYLGKKQGMAWRYYLSGKLYCLERFKNNLSHGKQEYFYEDGTLKTLLHYKGGELHGEARLFWPQGTPKRFCCYENGKKIGFDRIWDETGKLIQEEEYAKTAAGAVP